MMKNEEIAHWAVAQSQKQGAELAEAFLLRDKSFSVRVRQGKVESIEQAEEKGPGY